MCGSATNGDIRKTAQQAPNHDKPLKPRRGGRTWTSFIGRRVAYWRARRWMSQQVFADRLGKSKSWVDKVERGVAAGFDKFSVV